ncbi:MAG TPA: HipA domain-containing protein [Candidatus Udaeobacter sp.]|jgi:serine/threonine-protein kinase HipA|nr:HipA domain-containing protein [Candidatus Udaeobacter sp.]
MTNDCAICGKTSEAEGRYHPACLRRLFGTPSLPIIELTHAEVLARAQEMAGRMSISGVQPKLSMSRQGSRLVPVSDGGQFILKPQTERFPLLPQNENLCITIAERMGIDVPPHGLFDLRDDSPAYIVRRFDRTPAGQKLRCEDFLQILGEDDKYAGSVERIGKKIRELSSVPGLDAQLFFERVLLNFLLGNGDAHLKNFSLLETEDGGLRLSPAYDIVCSKAVIPKETDFAVTLNGKSDKITRRDFEKFSEALKIPPKVVADIFERFGEGHSMMSDEISRSRLSAELQEKMQRVIEERRKRIFG